MATSKDTLLKKTKSLLRAVLASSDEVKSSEFNRIKVKIDKDKKQIYQIIRYGKDGNDYTITLSKITKESTLADAMFKYDKTKHPDVELIDLRD
jgi:outer membrane lipoprotein-sorting protein